MRITMTTSGSREDVEPLLALGEELLGRGHEVVLCGAEYHAERVSSAGMMFVASPGDPPEVMLRSTLAGNGASGRYGVRRRFTRQMTPLFEEQFATFRRAAIGSDIVVFTLLGLGGFYAARSLGLPAIAAMFSPAYVSTAVHPSAMSPAHFFRLSHSLMPSLRTGLNLLSYQIARETAWQVMRPIAQPILKRQGMPPEPFISGPLKTMERSSTIQLYAYSPAVSPEPSDWPASCRVTGYWSVAQDPPADRRRSILDGFLADGPRERTVAVGFGSMNKFDRETTIDCVLGALKAARLRAVILAGWGGLGWVPPRMPHLLFADEVPYDYLYPRVTAAVFDGGSGTTGAVVRAGLPAVTIPHFADQFYWGHRLHDLGCSPQPIPKSALNENNLASALTEVVTNDDLRRRAAAVGDTVRLETPGQVLAADLIEHAVRASSRVSNPSN